MWLFLTDLLLRGSYFLVLMLVLFPSPLDPLSHDYFPFTFFQMQVSPYSRVPEIEISRSPDGLVQVGMMPNLTSLHYGDYGVLAVSPYQPSGELKMVSEKFLSLFCLRARTTNNLLPRPPPPILTAVSPYGELCSLHGSIEPSPVTIITASPVLASNLDSSPQISPEK